MKIIFNFTFILITTGLFSACSSTKEADVTNMMATMQMDTPVEGACNSSKIVFILPIPGNGQISAKSTVADGEIEIALNEEVIFLKDKPKFSDKGMVRMIVNCRGEMVQCEIDNKTTSPELDQQIVDVFSTLTTWTPATVHGQPVDSSVLYSFTIENGNITL